MSNKLNGFNELSNNYLQEVNPIYSKNETNFSNKNFKSNTNLGMNNNPLMLIHQKYSQIERLKASGVEILNEKENNKDEKNEENKVEDLKIEEEHIEKEEKIQSNKEENYMENKEEEKKDEKEDKESDLSSKKVPNNGEPDGSEI